MTKVLVGREAARSAPVVSAPNLAEAVIPPLTAFGLVLSSVGVVDLGLAWFPLRFGVGEWEFGVASRTFDSLALGTTGFVFLVVAAAARYSAPALRVLGVLSVLMTVALASVITLYALNAPVALQFVDEGTRALLLRAMFRTSAFAGLYITLYGWLSWFTWRRAGAALERS